MGLGPKAGMQHSVGLLIPSGLYPRAPHGVRWQNHQLEGQHSKGGSVLQAAQPGHTKATQPHPCCPETRPCSSGVPTTSPLDTDGSQDDLAQIIEELESKRELLKVLGNSTWGVE